MQAVGNIKYCTLCKQNKDIDNFYRNKRNKDGFNIWCKPCASKKQRENNIKVGGWYKRNINKYREYRKRWRSGNKNKIHQYTIKQEYGITIEQYNEMLVMQDGRCAICSEYETSTHKGKICRLSVDHDHATGRLRQLLCKRCNSVIGMVRDNIQLLNKAISYIELHKGG